MVRTASHWTPEERGRWRNIVDFDSMVVTTENSYILLPVSELVDGFVLWSGVVEESDFRGHTNISMA